MGSAAFGLSALRPDFVAAPLAGHLLFVVQGTWLLFIAFALFTAEKEAGMQMGCAQCTVELAFCQLVLVIVAATCVFVAIANRWYQGARYGVLPISEDWG